MTTVLGYLKEELPSPLDGQVEAVLKGGSLPTDLTGGLGELLGKKQRDGLVSAR